MSTPITQAAREAAEKIHPWSEWYSSRAEWKIDLDEAARHVQSAIDQARAAVYRECAEYVLQLHLAQKPKTGAIDALKTAYDEFNRRAKQ